MKEEYEGILFGALAALFVFFSVGYILSQQPQWTESWECVESYEKVILFYNDGSLPEDISDTLYGISIGKFRNLTPKEYCLHVMLGDIKRDDVNYCEFNDVCTKQQLVRVRG